MVLRVIFDTNIFGNLLEEPDTEEIERRINEEKDFIVYNFLPIRKELRNIPTTTKASKKARKILLSMYDRITGDHFLKNSIVITSLAKKYFDHYRNLGGIYGWDTNIRIDFMIIACASFNGLDVVYSDDQRTMLGKVALKAYQHININENLRTPDFLKYEDILQKFRMKL
ncbi:MAG: hypothetical protein ABIH82_06270 [Candidatus Woesearchaeota archaeon]|nr:PIN domain-containing protein [Nanoarchaeota archaeon]MBU1973796.1 PIN domain-containing protein [Nanoarchaeota archaeon]